MCVSLRVLVLLAWVVGLLPLPVAAQEPQPPGNGSVTVFLPMIARSQPGTGGVLFQGLDPLAGHHDLAGSDEMVLVWTEEDTNSDYASHQKIYDFLHIPEDLEQSIIPKPQQTETDAGVNPLFGETSVDVATGNFNDDAYDDLVAAWEGAEQMVQIIVPAIQRSTFSWTPNDMARLTSGPLRDIDSAAQRRIRLGVGDFDGDVVDEFLLAYWGADEKIHLEIYDTHRTLTPQLVAMIADETIPEEYRQGAQVIWDVGVGDFDGDGDSEIAFIGPEAREPAGEGKLGDYGLFFKVYDYNPDGPGLNKLVAKQRQDIFHEPWDTNSAVPILGIAAGDFNNDAVDEIAFAYGLIRHPTFPYNYTYLQIIQVTDNLTQMQRGPQITHSQLADGPLAMAAGDLNDDKWDEIALQQGQGGNPVKIYDADDEFTLTERAQANVHQGGNNAGNASHRYLAIADLDADTQLEAQDENWKAELVVVENGYDSQGNPRQRFRITVYTPQLNAEGRVNDLEEIGQRFDAPNNATRQRYFALALGDFDGTGIRLGRPTYYSKTDVVEPMVILNAPPVHFDVLNGTTYDVSLCYNENDCQFRSTYTKTTVEGVEVSTEFHQDWGISLEAKGKLNLFGVGKLKGHMEKTWGEGFANVQGRSSKVTVSVSVDAIEDDRIYATVIDYDIWEYPLYTGDARQNDGYIAVIRPRPAENRWFPSKSWSGYTYRPDHEVGNLLSYPNYNTLTENPGLGVRVKGSSNESYSLDANSSIDWTLTYEDFTSQQVATSHAIDQEWGVSVEVSDPAIATYEVGIRSTYKENEISTRTSTVANTLSLQIHLDGIDRTLGETGYIVTPYAYWANNGALVVDYTTRPEVANPGNPPTWWQVQYGGQPDPAFILPWRLDPEKGFELQDPVRRYQTKELVFIPTQPAPGDTVTIRARVHNYSLLPTSGPVRVRFFLGDPDNGGVPLNGTNPNSDVATATSIPARSNDTVEISWTIPASFADRFPRIYAVIDPDNTMAEIHEDNNKGYTVLELDIPGGP